MIPQRQSPELLAAAAGTGSFFLLAGAFAFQAAGYAPCHLCVLQRWPHAAAILAALLFQFAPKRIIAAGGCIAALLTALIALFHTGVERRWWAGPQSCTSGDVSAIPADQLLAQIMAAPLVQCDQAAWSLLGLSMASWNGILSLVLAGIWALALRPQAASQVSTASASPEGAMRKQQLEEGRTC